MVMLAPLHVAAYVSEVCAQFRDDDFISEAVFRETSPTSHQSKQCLEG